MRENHRRKGQTGFKKQPAGTGRMLGLAHRIPRHLREMLVLHRHVWSTCRLTRGELVSVINKRSTTVQIYTGTLLSSGPIENAAVPLAKKGLAVLYIDRLTASAGRWLLVSDNLRSSRPRLCPPLLKPRHHGWLQL